MQEQSKNKITFKTLMLIVFAITTICKPVLQAQDISGFSLSPAENLVTLEQHINNSHSIFITNNEDISVGIDVEVFETKENTNIIEDPSLQISSQWISIKNDTTFTLNPNETKEIVYQINFPENIPQTLLQSTIFFNVNKFDPENDSYKFLIRMPYLVNFIPVADDTESGNEINQVELQSSYSFQNSNSISFKISNVKKINSFTKPIVYFQVLNRNSVPIFSEILNEGAKAIINDEQLSFTEKFNIPPELLNDFGSYSVEIMVVDSLSNFKAISKTSFTNIPYYYLIALVGIGVGVYVVSSNRKKILRTQRVKS